jgi:hypothetical protein
VEETEVSCASNKWFLLGAKETGIISSIFYSMGEYCWKKYNFELICALRGVILTTLVWIPMKMLLVNIAKKAAKCFAYGVGTEAAMMMPPKGVFDASI